MWAVCLDTGHAKVSGDIYSVTHKLGQHLRMIHAHDNHGNGDEHLAPGNGNIDWNRFLTELDWTGFRGGFILELASMDNVQHLLAEARTGKRFLSRNQSPIGTLASAKNRWVRLRRCSIGVFTQLREKMRAS